MNDNVFKVVVDFQNKSVRCRSDIDKHRYFTKTDYGYFYDNNVYQHKYVVVYSGDKKHAKHIKSNLHLLLQVI
jgi:hypothetical protein